ncbi:flagellar protein FlaG [Paenibacillus sp. ACRRY]|uniref:flagellar protein FlaG n=1 Tax=Paenibacillus sp. ACRRY TaxID=2918208 RepID=UPI001EF5BA90|nr:flagellar protein FlaG [Paenibacillus sp. ACRRY]MCG7384097.1 flagellar protein FlaG [Paenibacillus sp. ACRRY]
MKIHQNNALSREIHALRDSNSNSNVLKTSEVNSSEFIQQKVNYTALTDEEKTKMEEHLAKLNKSLIDVNKQIQFKYNDETEELNVEVIDTSTKEVIASLPPEFLIELSLQLKEIIGMFFDEKV